MVPPMWTLSAGQGRPAGLWRGLWAGVRLVLAVLALVATAVDAYLTARLGWRPILPAIGRLAALAAREARLRAAGVVDAEVIDDSDQPDQEVWR
mgnify:CR=1 FL=1|jgi:hypothetical protein